jgi:hypothetical protein
MANTIEEVLNNGYIIAADEYGHLVTWNGSNTFCFWIQLTGIKGLEGWINTSVKTIYGPDLAMAERIAKEWLFNPEDWEVCHTCRRPTDPDEWNTEERLCVDCVQSAENDKEGDQ